MKMNAWGKLATIGAAFAMVALACNSSTSTGGAGGAAGMAGTSGSGGSGGGMAGSGGSGGGMAGSGGSAGGGEAGPCQTCLQTDCPMVWTACLQDTTCQAEFACIQNCVLGDAGTGSGSSVSTCAGQCNMDGGTIASTTNDLISCIDNQEASTNCNAECFAGAQP